MNVKSVVFDAYGTLFDVNSAAEKCKDKIGDKWEGFANFWRTTQLEYTWLRSLMRRHKDFWTVTEDSLDKSMKVFKIETIDISNIPIGILSSDGTIYPSKFLERKILPTPLPLYEPSSIYVNTRGFSWSLYTIYSKNIDRCREYVNVRPYLGPVNTWIMNNN